MDIKKNMNAAKEIIIKMNIKLEERACLENIIPLLKRNEEDEISIGKIMGTILTIDEMRF